MKNKKYHTVGSIHIKFNMTRKEKGDLSIGVVYIPPENTSYSSPDSFIQLENEYINIS